METTLNFEKTFLGRENTKRTYHSLYKNWIKQIPKEKLTEEYLYTLVPLWESKLSKQTTKMLTRLFYKYLEFNGMEIKPGNSKRLIKLIDRSEQDEPPKALTKTESEKIIKLCREKYNNFYPILLLGIHAGLRRGEIFGLQKRDIDYTSSYITVRRSYNGPTKNGKSRKIPMSQKLAEALKIRYLQLKKDDSKLFNEFDPNLILRRICKEAKVNEISIHGLRHTYATLALEAGTSPKIVQDLLGHSSLNTTFMYWNNTNKNIDLTFLP